MGWLSSFRTQNKKSFDPSRKILLHPTALDRKNAGRLRRMQKKPGICRAFFRAAISESATHVSLFCKIDGRCALSLPLRAATALDALIVALFLQRVGREKFVDRESNSAEQLAGICAAATTAAAGAFLFRHTIAVAGGSAAEYPAPAAQWRTDPT